MAEEGDNTRRVAEEIRRIGFVRWHERTLIRAHLYLVSCLLGLVLIPLAFEIFSDPQDWWDWVQRYAVLFGGALLAMFGWRSFSIRMVRAQRRADRARCPKCEAYGAFKVRDHGASPAQEEPGAPAPGEADGWIRVQCRRCGEQWNL